MKKQVKIYRHKGINMKYQKRAGEYYYNSPENFAKTYEKVDV